MENLLWKMLCAIGIYNESLEEDCNDLDHWLDLMDCRRMKVDPIWFCAVDWNPN